MNVLVDTSIWIDYLNHGDDRLVALLEDMRVLVHPFVTGEIALGNLRRRDVVLQDLGSLPPAAVATEDEVLHAIARHGLNGIGIGYIDAHLIAATMLSAGTSLWTRDKRLRAAAERLEIAAGWE